tara:strand:- start:423 stop:845 length:423 start_codon:yes stop_codon:yes gene_type:complete
MRYGELLHLLFIDLQRIFRLKIIFEDTSFQQLIAISIIPLNDIAMSSIAKVLGIDNSTATRLVAGLENKGWIKRIKCKDDKRIIMVSLTNRGLGIQNKLEKKINDLGILVEKRIKPKLRLETNEGLRLLHWELLKMIDKK